MATKKPAADEAAPAAAVESAPVAETSGLSDDDLANAWVNAGGNINTVQTAIAFARGLGL